MNVSYDLNQLENKPLTKNKNHMILYCTEKDKENPYIYFLMNKNENNIIHIPICDNTDEFMKDNFNKSQYEFKGVLIENDINYLFYHITLNETTFLPTYHTDKWWKVFPFELLYTGHVLQYKIDKNCIDFFKRNPSYLVLFYHNMRYETPVVGYIGIGASELNDQLILHNKNNRNGIFKNGFYFESVEKGYYQALYNTHQSSEYILKLANHNYIVDTIPITSINVTVKNDKFYLDKIYLGDVPSHCKKNGVYELYFFDEDMIYLRTNLDNLCTEPLNTKREENGYLMRYILFLNNHWVGKKSKKGYDSFAYDNTYMINNEDNFSCVSYHIVDKKNVVERFNKDITVNIL